MNGLRRLCRRYLSTLYLRGICLTVQASTETETFEDHWRATQLQSGSSLVASITCLPPRYVADFLVQIFFKYAQTNNFYVEEEWLLDKLNICYTDPSALAPDDAGSVCAILMVLAVGTQFAHMESPTPVNQLSEDHRFSEDEVGLTFYQFASKLLPDIIATTSVRSVQACLLIGTYLLPLDTSGLCYTYFGLALKMAIQNGMHRRYQGEGLSRRMVEVRNRVFWTAYTIEKYAFLFFSPSPEGILLTIKQTCEHSPWATSLAIRFRRRCRSANRLSRSHAFRTSLQPYQHGNLDQPDVKIRPGCS